MASTRGKFYDQTGVLRDIVQNHLLEVLALIAMEAPNSMHADDVRNEKLKVVRALREHWSDTVERDVVLGQYRGYRDEPDVSKQSTTPTFAALRVYVDNWRWQGVPFYLRAGKKLKKRVTEISVHLQPIPLSLFGRQEVCEDVQPNVLTLRIQPDEGIELTFASKIPGDDLCAGTVKMDMNYLGRSAASREAYGGCCSTRCAATRRCSRAATGSSVVGNSSVSILRRIRPRLPDYEPGSGGRVCDMVGVTGQWREL